VPIYEYAHKEPAPQGCAQVFEVTRSVRDEPLGACPICGQAVTRIISRVHQGRNVLSPANVKDKGFTRLRKDCDGGYRPESQHPR
jgi:putative FmdB family regulatory protein